MSTNISKYDDTIDSRDIIERIEELEAIETPEADEAEELVQLRALAEECEKYASDWKYGEILVRGSYWTKYVREIAEDCGDVPRDLPDYIAIDWETTARYIQADYASVEFDGVTYWIRSC